MNCESCINYNECEYKSILIQLQDGVNKGILESSVPFSCDFKCEKYESGDIIVPPQPNGLKYSKNKILLHNIRKKIYASANNNELNNTLDILEFVRLDNTYYMTISYMYPTAYIQDVDEMKKYLYMIVSIFQTWSKYSMSVYRYNNYRINLLEAKYNWQVFNPSDTGYHSKIYDPYVYALVHLLNRNYYNLYTALCTKACSMILELYPQYYNKIVLSSQNMPNYMTLNKCGENTE